MKHGYFEAPAGKGLIKVTQLLRDKGRNVPEDVDAGGWKLCVKFDQFVSSGRGSWRDLAPPPLATLQGALVKGPLPLSRDLTLQMLHQCTHD